MSTERRLDDTPCKPRRRRSGRAPSCPHHSRDHIDRPDAPEPEWNAARTCAVTSVLFLVLVFVFGMALLGNPIPLAVAAALTLTISVLWWMAPRKPGRGDRKFLVHMARAWMAYLGSGGTP